MNIEQGLCKPKWEIVCFMQKSNQERMSVHSVRVKPQSRLKRLPLLQVKPAQSQIGAVDSKVVPRSFASDFMNLRASL